MARIAYLDLLRIVAVIAVVVVHVSAPLVVVFPPAADAHWWIANSVDSAARFCVPLFFMLSGAVVLGNPRNYSVPYLLRKRVLRMLVVLLAWSALYLYLYPDMAKGDWVDKSWAIVSGPAVYHLWFIYTLVGLYLLTPLFGVFVNAAGRDAVIYFLCLWWLIAGLNPLLHHFGGYSLPFFSLPNPLHDPFIYSGYYLLGYYLHHRLPRPALGWALLSLTAGILATLAATHYFSYRHGQFFEFFYRYTTLNVLATSVGVFLLGQYLQPRLAPWQGWLSSLASLSLGVYLLHILVITELNAQFHLHGGSYHPALAIPLVSACVLLLSALCVLLLRRVPLLGRWLA